jgi:predicted lipoprotein with Yx(FWY)xxD motif
VLVVGVAFGLATAARYGLIERDDLGSVCEAASPASICGLRLLLIKAFQLNFYAYASLALAAVASWSKSPALAYLGAAIATFGMVLYTFTWSGAGVLACALALARMQPQWAEDGEPQQHAR